jgi:hypothetical protein
MRATGAAEDCRCDNAATTDTEKAKAQKLLEFLQFHDGSAQVVHLLHLHSCLLCSKGAMCFARPLADTALCALAPASRTRIAALD